MTDTNASIAKPRPHTKSKRNMVIGFGCGFAISVGVAPATYAEK